MNKQTLISTIRKESRDIPCSHYSIILDSFQLKSFSRNNLGEMVFSRLTSLLNRIRELVHEYIPKCCPWCGEKAEVYSNGSYVSGWTSFVRCSDSLGCGVMGPKKKSPKGMLEDEYIIRDSAIKTWNKTRKRK